MKIKGIMSEPVIPVFARISLKEAYLRLKDGGSVEMLVKIGDGNITYSEKKTMEYMLDRGALDAVREGDDIPVDVAFDFTWEYIIGQGTSGQTGSVEDFLKGQNAYASNVSSDSDACNPFAVTIEIDYMPNPYSCGDKETIVLADFRYESLDHDVSNASVSCAGRCNITQAAITRATQTST